MSNPAPNTGLVGPDTLITVKILIDGQNRRFKLALRDLGAHVLPQKLRFLLQIPPGTEAKFERFSDSAGNYITLDSTNPTVYKQLYRAAKAKLKLRLKATLSTPEKVAPPPASQSSAQPTETKDADGRATNFFETVLAKPALQQPDLAQFQSRREHVLKLFDETPTVLSRPTLPSLNDFCGTTFSIDCNHCGASVSNEHYHCSKCEMGDFDLCPSCIEAGVTCNGEDHWLIKRTITSGKVVASSTETLPPKKEAQPVPVAEPQPAVEEDQRTCNSCIIQLGASSFVTCQQCADYDICFICLENGQHGHHPAHTFVPVDAAATVVPPFIKTLCQQGRGLKHEAVCDGCNAQIVGVRHKCLTCPDFDYCSTCVHAAPEAHPSHRFGAIYEQLSSMTTKKEVHHGIYCDGLLCNARAKKTYIRGDRYKCAICHDTDFCANCEALPTNPHNPTHPLIKLRTPVRQLSVSAVNEEENGVVAPVMGDRRISKHAATETTQSSSANAATQVHTVAGTRSVQHKVEDESKHLDARFESESTPDGSTFSPNHLVRQSWTLRNTGPTAWPAGCAVHYIGGDDMRNLDDKHPSSVSTMTAANRSNVCEEPVEPNETYTFHVLLKSPGREGQAISYWRLKTADGLPFGHKLWCDINVVSKPVEAPAVVPVEAPTEKTPLAEPSQESSLMIFPKLEKESPESSITNIKPVEPTAAAEEQDLIDDLDSMALDDESTEDGFLTDEEYDILDAEDEEYLMAAQHAAANK